MNDNLCRCKQCGLSLIVEEEDIHLCRPVVSHMVLDGQLWLGDGVQYYPIKRGFKPVKKSDQPQGNINNNYRGGNSTKK